MLESDDDLVDTIKEMQEARGRGDKFNPRQLHEKIEVIGPAINLDKLTQSIDVEILERLGVSWDRWFGLLKKFHSQKSHCRVKRDYQADGFRLGWWVIRQRNNKNSLNAEQVRQLDSINFTWDPYSEQWESAFAELGKFRNHNGHCRVPNKPREGSVRLGAWVSHQRLNKAKLTPNRIRRLDSLGFSWDPFTEQWEEGFAALNGFRKRNGHCRVTKNTHENGVNLGTWVTTQRHKKESLSDKQISRLESLGFSWDPFTEQWEEGFAALRKFRKREGHCRVVRSHLEDGVNLGGWVTKQRHKKAKLTPDRIKRLSSLNFIW